MAGRVSCSYDLHSDDKAQSWKKQKPLGPMTVWHFMPHGTGSPHTGTEWWRCDKLATLPLIIHNTHSKGMINPATVDIWRWMPCFVGWKCPCFVEWWTILHLPVIIQYTLLLCVCGHAYVWRPEMNTVFLNHLPPCFLRQGLSLWTQSSLIQLVSQ